MQPQKCAAKDQGRYAMNGVALANLGKHGTCLTATDGMAAVVIPVQITEGALNGRPLILSIETAKAATDAVRKASKHMVYPCEVSVNPTAANAETLCLGNRTSGLLLDGEFPRVEGVIPPMKKERRLSFNVKLLYQLAQAMGVEELTLHVPKFREGCVRDAIYVQPGKCPHQTEDGRRPFGVIMPMTLDT